MKRVVLFLTALIFAQIATSAQTTTRNTSGPTAGKYYIYYHPEERSIFVLMFDAKGGVKQRKAYEYNGELEFITSDSFHADGYYEKDNIGGYTLHLYWKESGGEGQKYVSGDMKRVYMSYNKYRGSADPDSKFIGIANNANHAASMIKEYNEAHKPSDGELFLELLGAFL